jgi:RHS repeat-associated protein
MNQPAPPPLAPFLKGGTELHKDGTGSVYAIRTYSLAGTPVAERTNGPTGGNTLRWLGDSNHNTATIEVVASSGATTVRYEDPYGNARGANPAWSSGHTFLNDDQAATSGTVTIGARTYDPVIGRFLSVDPVLSPSDPQQNNGYSYAHNDPVSMSDPTGLDPNIASSCSTLACRNGMYGGSSGKAPAAAGNKKSTSAAGGVGGSKVVRTNEKDFASQLMAGLVGSLGAASNIAPPQPGGPASAAKLANLFRRLAAMTDSAAAKVLALLGQLWARWWHPGAPSLEIGVKYCEAMVCGIGPANITNHLDVTLGLGVGLDEGGSWNVGVSSSQGGDTGFGMALGGELATPRVGAYVKGNVDLPITPYTNSYSGGFSAGDEAGVSAEVTYTLDPTSLINSIRGVLNRGASSSSH